MKFNPKFKQFTQITKARNLEKMAGDEAFLMTSLVYLFSPYFPEGDGVSFRGYDRLLERETITSEFVCHFESTVCKVNHEVSASVWKYLPVHDLTSICQYGQCDWLRDGSVFAEISALSPTGLPRLSCDH